MTLVVAADVQDHLILAGDHCAVLSEGSNTTAQVIIRNYQKVHSWKYGAIAGSGDAILMAMFWRLFLLQERPGVPMDLLQIAKGAKAARTRAGAPASECVGNIFFTLPGPDGFALHGLYIGEYRIELETIGPINTRFSMQEERAPSAVACNAFNRSLRPALFFNDTDAFDAHHLDLLRGSFAGQSAVDDLVTSSFDAIILNKRTGIGRFWWRPDAVRLLVSLKVESDADDVASISHVPRLPRGTID